MANMGAHIVRAILWIGSVFGTAADAVAGPNAVLMEPLWIWPSPLGFSEDNPVFTLSTRSHKRTRM